MGIFSIFNRRETPISYAEDNLLKAILGGDVFGRGQALAVPSVASSVDLITNIFASIPIKLYKETTKDGKKTTKEIFDNRTRLLNDDTKDTLTAVQFKKALCEDYLLGKGGYAYIEKKKNEFVALYFVRECDICILKNEDKIKKSYSIEVDGKRYHDYDFLKMLRNTKDGASGRGLTEEIRTALRTEYERLKYEYSLAQTGGSRKGFLKSPNKLGKEEMKALKDAWNEYYSGNSSTVILNNGMEFQEASNTSRENELQAKEQQFAQVIRDVFHIGATLQDTIRFAIEPIMNEFICSLNRDLLLEKEKNSYYFAPDYKEINKASLKERYDAYAVAIANGFKTRNEIRYMENDDAIEGLDIVTLGLGDVFLNSVDGTMYVPNTDKFLKMTDKNAENEENEGKTDANVGESTNIDVEVQENEQKNINMAEIK